MESLTKTPISDELATKTRQVWYHLKAAILDYLYVEKSLLQDARNCGNLNIFACILKPKVDLTWTPTGKKIDVILLRRRPMHLSSARVPTVDVISINQISG